MVAILPPCSLHVQIRECPSIIEINSFIEKVMKINIIPITNKFFGENITITGLITGQDIIEQLSGIELGEELIIPKVMLKSDEDVFLDDSTLCDVEEKLGVKIIKTSNTGYGFIKAILETEV